MLVFEIFLHKCDLYHNLFDFSEELMKLVFEEKSGGNSRTSERSSPNASRSTTQISLKFHVEKSNH